MPDNETKPAAAPQPRVIVYKGGESPSVAIVNQHGRKKADVNPASSDAVEAFSKLLTEGGTGQLIDPPFDFDVVADLGEKNSILPPLIQAMVVNIDGTGAEIVNNGKQGEESEAGKKQSEKERGAIQEYFDEPYPGESFLTQRRAMRNEQERIGNAYLEIMRNAMGEVIFWKPIIPAKNMRLIRLDDPVDVEKIVTRNGKDQKVVVPVRERRFVQAVGTKAVWFKEFGASRDVNRETGEWAEKGVLEFKLRGNEIIHFKNQPDPFSPYGLPRWWSNSPSVLGSRRAEEFNLLFFDSGGIPPMMLIVSGGALATEAEKALRDHFLATGINRHAAIVLEAYSTGGTVDNPSNVKIQVERFGSERQNDSMFEKYIENCDKRVQRSFRIPGQFIGMSDDFTFATALSSMLVAEAQVFACERQEFDEIINLKLMPELPNGEKYLYRSKTLALADTERQLAGLGLIKALIPPKMLVERVGETVGWPDLTLTDEDLAVLDERETADREAKARQPAFGAAPPDGGEGKPKPKPGKAKPKEKFEFSPGLITMAQEMAEVLQIGLARPEEVARFKSIRAKVATLDDGQREQFRTLLTAHMLPALEHDPDGAQELTAFALDVTTREVEGR
jgi:capsid portal protein